MIGGRGEPRRRRETPGVCTASNGPGAANVLPGIAVENGERNRVLVLTSWRAAWAPTAIGSRAARSCPAPSSAAWRAGSRPWWTWTRWSTSGRQACDVTDDDACRAAVAAAREALGPVDLLVANAGINHVGRVCDTEIPVLERVMDVNLFGAVRLAKAALPDLLARRGQIVAVGSIAGQAPLDTRAGYAASKHALHGFFRSLRAEHEADGLGVLLVDPFFVDTAIGGRALGPDGRPAAARSGVDAGALEPDDVAHAILRALLRRRRQLFVPRRAGALVWAARLAPGWFERRMARRMALPEPAERRAAEEG